MAVLEYSGTVDRPGCTLAARTLSYYIILRGSDATDVYMYTAVRNDLMTCGYLARSRNASRRYSTYFFVINLVGHVACAARSVRAYMLIVIYQHVYIATATYMYDGCD
jgi:hypothetical protein